MIIVEFFTFDTSIPTMHTIKNIPIRFIFVLEKILAYAFLLFLCWVNILSNNNHYFSLLKKYF